MSASAGMPSAAAAATASSMRSVPSTTEYSLCSRRWTNDGAGIGSEAVELRRRRRSATATILLPYGHATHRPRVRDSRSPMRMRIGARSLLVLAGCAARTATPPATPATPSHRAPAPHVEPPPPPVNLQGFPPAYRRASAMAARPAAAPREGRRCASATTATIASAGRTVSRNASGNDDAIASRDEAVALAVRRRARAVAITCARGAIAARAQALPAARLDGRVGVVPVPGRRARAATGTCWRPTGAASACRKRRRTATGFPTTSPISTRWSHALAPGRARRRRRPQPRRQRRHALGRRAAGEGGARRLARRLRHSRRAPPTRAPDKLRKWLDALRDPPSFAPYAEPRRGRGSPAEDQSTPRRATKRSSWRRTGPRRCPTARRGCARIRSTSCRSRRRRAWTTSTRSGARIAAPVLWIAADGFAHPRWLARRKAIARAEIARAVRAHSERHARIRRATPATCCITTSRRRWRGCIEAFLASTAR